MQIPVTTARKMREGHANEFVDRQGGIYGEDGNVVRGNGLRNGR